MCSCALSLARQVFMLSVCLSIGLSFSRSVSSSCPSVWVSGCMLRSIIFTFTLLHYPAWLFLIFSPRFHFAQYAIFLVVHRLLVAATLRGLTNYVTCSLATSARVLPAGVTKNMFTNLILEQRKKKCVWFICQSI